tara:strand:- start:757 stop:1374 length:618 start_codon:yes stop_codon:yes gene_type:complete
MENFSSWNKMQKQLLGVLLGLLICLFISQNAQAQDFVYSDWGDSYANVLEDNKIEELSYFGEANGLQAYGASSTLTVGGVDAPIVIVYYFDNDKLSYGTFVFGTTDRESDYDLFIDVKTWLSNVAVTVKSSSDLQNDKKYTKKGVVDYKKAFIKGDFWSSHTLKLNNVLYTHNLYIDDETGNTNHLILFSPTSEVAETLSNTKQA